MSKFIVDRKTWQRGSVLDSALLNWQGAKCCLGFVGEQCGVKADKLLTILLPHDLLNSDLVKYPLWLQSRIAQTDCACINDATTLNEYERESKLIEVFLSHGDELEFVG